MITCTCMINITVGLPATRQDMFLCVITRIKNVLIPTNSTTSTSSPRKRKHSSHVLVPESPEVHVTAGTDRKHKARGVVINGCGYKGVLVLVGTCTN